MGYAEAVPHDLDALLAARDGDHDAGRRLVERHGPSMVRTAWSVLGRYGGTEADDVVQEALVTALTTPALPRGDDVGAWLRAITVRKALDWLRRSARRREQPFSEPGTEGAQPVAAGNPEAALDVLTVRRLLARLAPLDRAVLVLADLEGRSMAEVADVLGSTRVAVKLRASRARRRLARMVGATGRRVARKGHDGREGT
jgi:RNA polymerase sigma-70 factor (ECF subfamily)